MPPPTRRSGPRQGRPDSDLLATSALIDTGSVDRREVVAHPAEFSPEVIAVFATRIPPGHVHDPYAGRGRPLGRLCNELGVTFSGTDCQTYRDADPRVIMRADAGDPSTYPTHEYTLVTSVIYLNGISSDYKDGATRNTNLEGRRCYSLSSLEGFLVPENLARLVVRSRSEHPAFWARFTDHVANWPQLVLLNVDAPMAADAVVALAANGYEITELVEVPTKRYRRGANRDVRPTHEVVIVGRRR